MDFNLRKVLKALLFSTSEPLAVKDVQAVILRFHQQAAAEAEEAADSDEPQGVLGDVLQQVPTMLTGGQIRDALSELEAELDERGEVFQLQEGPTGWRLVLRPDYAAWVRLLRGNPRPQRLGPALMETLAVVAYRQPVTRTEIEAIRGVACDRPLSKLVELELVQILGRAELPGRPIQYGTTDRFLEHCGVRSLDELPASDVLSPNQLSEWIRMATEPEGDGGSQQVQLEL